METQIYKHFAYGWTAESTIELDVAKNRYLRFVTMKRSSGDITTTVSAVVIKDDIVTMTLFGDYTKQLGRTKARATERVIGDFHLDNVEQHLVSVLEEAKAFYLAKGE